MILLIIHSIIDTSIQKLEVPKILLTTCFDSKLLALISSQEQKPRLDHNKIITTKKIEEQLYQQLEHLEQEIAIMGLQLKEIEQEQEQQRQEQLEQRREREQRQQRQRQKQQEQEQEQKQKQKSTFYIVKRRIVGNLWEPISLFDENNNFRGQAVFDTLQQAEDYQKKFEYKLVLRDLRP